MITMDNKKDLPISDGTSQSERLLAALNPKYAPVDERTTVDLLNFAKAYARELKYISVDNIHDGNWSGLFTGNDGNPIDLQAAYDYIQRPDDFSAEQAHDYARPHFALLLVFLELLSYSRRQLNALTRRHLEFCYRDVLCMARKKAIPDQVHVLVELESDTPQQRLPAGAEVLAGEDHLGQPLIYITERELIASQIDIAQLRSLYAQRNITGLREACPPELKSSHANRREAFMHMLRIALGQPNPGDPLPLPIYTGAPAADPNNPVVTFNMVVNALDLLAIADRELGITSFDDFRLLMRLKQQRREHNAGNWTEINAILEAAGKKRTGDVNFTLQPSTPDNFERHLQTVLGLSGDGFGQLFDGLPEVTNVDEAYAVYLKRADVQQFVTKSLYLSLENFQSMMQIKIHMESEWEEINRLLEAAGQRKRDREGQGGQFTLPNTERAAQDFSAKLAAAVGEPNYMIEGAIDDYYRAFTQVEQYFHMSAENFAYIMSVVGTEGETTGDEHDWNTVYTILTAAHREMLYSRRRNHLKQIAQPNVDHNSLQALIDLLAVVLDKQLAVSVADAKAAVDELDHYGVTIDNRNYLKAAADNHQPDWERVYRLLEIAWRNREDYRPPYPESIEWRNLYPASDATAVSAQSANEPSAADDNLPRWKTFGRGESARAQQPVPSADFGWAIASPLLELTEGKRTVTLTLGFSAAAEHFDTGKLSALFAPAEDSQTATANPFYIQFSTAEGWLQATSTQLKWFDADMTYPQSALGGAPTGGKSDGDEQQADADPLKALIFECVLAEGEAALAAPAHSVHGMDAAAPALRLMVKPVWNEAGGCYLTSSYTVLRELVLMRAHLAVAVKGLANLTIANDHGGLDAKKPFEPFGFQPAAGSRFYLGHREIVAKTLDSLKFNIDWMGAPADFKSHYANYANPENALDKTSFKATVSLVEGNVAKNFTNPLQLFAVEKNSAEQLPAPLPPADQGNPGKATTGPANVTEWERYLQWELGDPDFQHPVYPSLALQKSLALATAIANQTKPNPADYQLNPPYTPKIKSLTIDYTAAATLNFETAALPGASPMQCFHVEPFGFAELAYKNTLPDNLLSGHPLLPQYMFEGELYIGLRNVTAPQNVALLFQMAEGSADPDLAPQPLQWSYLSGNRWLSLQDEGALLADATRGLVNSGIVELALKPTRPSTLLPDGLYWIRIAIERAAQSVCDIVAIHPNAVLATSTGAQNSADVLHRPLPPASIEAPLQAVPGIARLRQPYSSFGGKSGEQDQHFYLRVSERLRHKGRALTTWDYERLVLEQFPQIYKAKCLCADPLDPGTVRLVVIPDIKNRLPFNPFEPKAPANTIRDIQAFLQEKMPPFVEIEVKNARYVPVKVRCGVRFMPGQDENFCRLQLNRELNRFLSPWAYEEGTDITIGGSIYANSIIDFIDSRDYVDYLAGFTLFAGRQEQLVKTAAEKEGYRVIAARPDEVLVAAREHIFDTISTADFQIEEFSGIGYMKMELDFIVAENKEENAAA